VSAPIFSDVTLCGRLLAELDTWIGTPWAHRAGVDGKQLAVKGEGGDCVTIILTALYNVGALEPLDLPAHALAPGVLPEERVAHSITKFVRPFIEGGRLQQLDGRTQPLLTGDLLTFRTRAARDHHLGIFRGGANRNFYHAPGPGRRFMISSLNEAGARFQRAYRLMAVVGEAQGRALEAAR